MSLTDPKSQATALTRATDIGQVSATGRIADHPILPQILERWSRRAFDPHHALTDEALNSLFEAARWAPSAFNLQPWRFVLARRGELGWSKMLEALIPFNKGWARHASALVYACSEVDAPGKDGSRQPLYSHSFDAGAAWAFLALLASALGLNTHAMTGFDPAAAHIAVDAPSNVRIDAVIAVGAPGDRTKLAEGLRERNPSGRNPISSFVFAQTFGAPIT
jgi:nitroreductase